MNKKRKPRSVWVRIYEGTEISYWDHRVDCVARKPGKKSLVTDDPILGCYVEFREVLPKAEQRAKKRKAVKHGK